MNSKFTSKNGWTKHFIDGTSLEGLDEDIPSGKCSWRNSKLNLMNRCNLVHEKDSIEICGEGDYWQSDTLMCFVSIGETSPPTWVTRRIEKRITKKDKYLITQRLENNLLRLNITDDNNLKNIEDMILIRKDQIGQWAIVELDVQSSIKKWYLSKEKI